MCQQSVQSTARAGVRRVSTVCSINKKGGVRLVSTERPGVCTLTSSAPGHRGCRNEGLPMPRILLSKDTSFQPDVAQNMAVHAVPAARNSA